jgi:hypothetical protein
MTNAQKLDTHHKALTLNLDPFTFSSFAEIGAGQEVARWFLVVGAASGTVAKTISAYDKEVGDDLDGSGSRIRVCRLAFFLSPILSRRATIPDERCNGWTCGKKPGVQC